MSNPLNRRSFIVSSSLGLALVSGSGRSSRFSFGSPGTVDREPGVQLRLSLNAYSFNRPLRDSEMTLEDVVDFCAGLGLEGLDATGYYFPGYPEVPDDDYLYGLKRRAFVNGMTINGTGVRNDFSTPDSDRRMADIELVKNWITVAEKLGAPIIRVFSGNRIPDGYTFEQVLDWMVPALKECVEYGKEHGVIVGLQNHNDFVKTADETIRIVERVDSEWFGVILDIGSLRQDDPYQEIARLLPYAASWQLKESIWYGDQETPTDLIRIKEIIDKGGYRGFLPLETLGPGDPKLKVERLVKEVRRVFGKI